MSLSSLVPKVGPTKTPTIIPVKLSNQYEVNLDTSSFDQEKIENHHFKLTTVACGFVSSPYLNLGVCVPGTSCPYGSGISIPYPQNSCPSTNPSPEICCGKQGPAFETICPTGFCMYSQTILDTYVTVGASGCPTPRSTFGNYPMCGSKTPITGSYVCCSLATSIPTVSPTFLPSSTLTSYPITGKPSSPSLQPTLKPTSPTIKPTVLPTSPTVKPTTVNPSPFPSTISPTTNNPTAEVINI